MNMWTKFFTTAALATMLCMTGQVMSGEAQAQQCVDNGDGTVTDNLMGLMWQKATAGPMNWDTAMSYASGLSLGGHSGWRLPSRDELANLYHSPCKSIMEVVSDGYWSSTTNAYNTSFVWLVYFSSGGMGNGNKLDSHYVRPVRAGQ